MENPFKEDTHHLSNEYPCHVGGIDYIPNKHRTPKDRTTTNQDFKTPKEVAMD